MLRTRTVFGVVGAILVVALMPLGMSAAEQFSGTWKMNPAKSKFNPGPAPSEIALAVEAEANNYKLEATGTDGSGKPIHEQCTAKFDGKDYPATGIQNADSVLVKRSDANTVETMQKKDGKVVMLILSKVSKDGKSRTSTWTGANAKGKDFHNVVVFDKQ